MKADLVERPVAAVRFPIRSPVPCPVCGGGIEILGPTECHCVNCGATQRKMRNEIERLKAVSSPEESDLFRAAAKLIPISQWKGMHWEQIKGPGRNELIKAARAATKALKEKKA